MARRKNSDSADAPVAKTGGGLSLAPEFRLTRQRREVFEVLINQRDHPTATEIFMRVKERIPGISLATVYNCLEALTQNGMVRQVNLDRSPSRYCPNLKEHGHFHCEGCGEVTDIDIPDIPAVEAALELPAGSLVHRLDISLRGLCRNCRQQQPENIQRN